MSDVVPMKRCPRCRQTKPRTRDHFYQYGKRWKSWCIECTRESARAAWRRKRAQEAGPITSVEQWVERGRAIVRLKPTWEMTEEELAERERISEELRHYRPRRKRR